MKLKKILSTTLLSAISATAIGVGTNCKLLANEKIIDNKIGKITQVSNSANAKYNEQNYIANNINDDSNNQTNDYQFSNNPYISLSSDDNITTLNMTIKFSKNDNNTSNNYETDELDYNKAILTIYTNELYKGNIRLDENESNKLETLLENDNESSVNEIVDILEKNLQPTSKYYNSNLSNTTINAEETNNINDSKNTENRRLARQIAKEFKIKLNNNSTTNNNQNRRNSINSYNKNNNKDSSRNYLDKQNINQQSLDKNSQNQLKTTNENNVRKTQNNTNLNENQTNISRDNGNINNTNLNEYNDSTNNFSRENEYISRRRNNQNRNTNNQTIENLSENINSSSRSKRADRMKDKNENSIIANRTPEQLSTEEYSKLESTSSLDQTRATRVPYRPNINNM